MGNQMKKCCTHCVKLQPDEQHNYTRFVEITGSHNRTYKCRKFFASNQSIKYLRMNELIIFTDATLTMKIPNTSLKLDNSDMERLQQGLKAEMYNNNLVIKEDCFVLSAIEEQLDSSFSQFKDFPQNKISESTENAEKLKLKNQIQEFTLRNKSRAFRFKNPLRDLAIGQIIVVIVPMYQKSNNLIILRQAVEQSLSMAEDLKTVGVSEISYMLGYEPTVFQKIIIQYILGFSRTRKDYVFKRINQLYYLTVEQRNIISFLKFINMYTKNKLQRDQGPEGTVQVPGQLQPRLSKIKKLGNLSKKQSFYSNNHAMGRRNTSLQNIAPSQLPSGRQAPLSETIIAEPPSPALSPIRNNSYAQNSSFNILDNNNSSSYSRSGENMPPIPSANKLNSTNSFHNNSLYKPQLHNQPLQIRDARFNGMVAAGFGKSKNNQSNKNLPADDGYQSQGSKVSETSTIRNVRLKSFKSKESSAASDYF